jgi:hypothetical protein
MIPFCLVVVQESRPDAKELYQEQIRSRALGKAYW